LSLIPGRVRAQAGSQDGSKVDHLGIQGLDAGYIGNAKPRVSG